MAKRYRAPWIAIFVIALVIAGGYAAQRVLLPPMGENNSWHPTGRVVNVQKSSIPIGVNGLGTVDRSSGLRVVTGIREADIKRIKVGDKAKAWLNEHSATIEGEIAHISNKPRMVNNQALYDVTLHMNEGAEVRNGTAAEVQIVLDHKQDVIVIPALALQEGDNGGKYVWVLPQNWSTGSKIKPVKRNVRIGYADERNAEITEGLKEGEKVVIPAAQK